MNFPHHEPGTSDGPDPCRCYGEGCRHCSDDGDDEPKCDDCGKVECECEQDDASEVARG